MCLQTHRELGLHAYLGYLQLLLIMFRGLSSGKFLALYELFGTGPLMPDTLATFRGLLDKPFPRHWRAKLPQQQHSQPAGPAPVVQITSLTIEVCLPGLQGVVHWAQGCNFLIEICCVGVTGYGSVYVVYLHR